MSFGMAGLGFIVGAAGLIMLIASLVQLAKTRSFAKCSEGVTGRVAGKFVHHYKNSRNYSLDIEYTVDGIAYKRSVPALLSEYETLETGDPFDLKYKPDHPKRVIRADNLSAKSARAVGILIIVSVALTAVGAALFALGRR